RFCELVPVFAFFGGWQIVADNPFKSRIRECIPKPVKVQLSHLAVRDHEGVLLPEGMFPKGVAEGVESLGADEDGITPGTEIDIDASSERHGGGVLTDPSQD